MAPGTIFFSIKTYLLKFIDDMLHEPSYGWKNYKGELIKQ